MDFSDALDKIRVGQKLARKGWNGPDQWIKMIIGVEFQGNVLEPFILIKTQQNKYVPWLASQGDLLADDWELR